MNVLEPQRGDIPGPVPSPLSQPYWEHCERGELAFQRCGVCGGATHTPAYLCAHCSSDALTWEVSRGTGAVYSWTTVWRPQSSAFTVPYVAVIVDMDEGWQILSNLVGCTVEDVHAGQLVQVEFHRIADGTNLPYFRPVTGDRGSS